MSTKPKPPRPAATSAEDIEQSIVGLGGMDVGALRAEWRRVVGTEPPSAFSKDLLARAIAYRLQKLALGGLNASTARLLRSLQKPGAEPPRQVKVGSVIVREHQGVLHEVLVTPGGFCWRGKTHGSLSAIARKITGVSWNGPRFFGLRSKEATESPEEARKSHAKHVKADQNARQGRGAGGRRSSIGVARLSGGAS